MPNCAPWSPGTRRSSSPIWTGAREFINQYDPLRPERRHGRGLRPRALQRYADLRAADTGRLHGLWLDGTLVGGVLFLDLRRGARQLRGRLLAGAGRHRRGLVTRAMRVLIDWAVDERGIHRVEWVAASGNEAQPQRRPAARHDPRRGAPRGLSPTTAYGTTWRSGRSWPPSGVRHARLGALGEGIKRTSQTRPYGAPMGTKTQRPEDATDESDHGERPTDSTDEEAAEAEVERAERRGQAPAPSGADADRDAGRDDPDDDLDAIRTATEDETPTGCRPGSRRPAAVVVRRPRPRLLTGTGSARSSPRARPSWASSSRLQWRMASQISEVYGDAWQPTALVDGFFALLALIVGVRAGPARLRRPRQAQRWVKSPSPGAGSRSASSGS